MHTGARIPGIQGGGGGGACKYSGCSVGGKRYCTTNFNNIMVQDFWLQSLSAQQIFLLLGNPGREPSFSMFLNHFTIIIIIIIIHDYQPIGKYVAAKEVQTSQQKSPIIMNALVQECRTLTTTCTMYT